MSLSPKSQRGLTLAIILMLAAVLMLIIASIGGLGQQQSAMSNMKTRQAKERYSSWSASQLALLQLSKEPDRISDLTGTLASADDYRVEFFNNRTGSAAITQEGITIPKGSVLLKSIGVVNGKESEPMYSLAFELRPRYEAAVFGESSIRAVDSSIIARADVAWLHDPSSHGRRPILLASRHLPPGSDGGTGQAPPPTTSPGNEHVGNATGSTVGGLPSVPGGLENLENGGLGTSNGANAGTGGGSGNTVTTGVGGTDGGTNGGAGETGDDGDDGTHLAGLSTNSKDTGSIVLEGTTTVDGDVKFGKGSEADVGPDFTNRVEGEVGANELDMPVAPIRLPENAPPVNHTPADIGSLSQGPGRFGSFTAPPGSSLTLKSGAYIFDGNVDLSNLNLVTDGPVKIYITGNLEANYARFAPFEGKASNLQFFILGEHEVDLVGVEGESALMGDKAKVKVTSAKITGAIVADTIELHNSVLQYDDRLETLEFDGSSEWIQRAIVVGQ